MLWGLLRADALKGPLVGVLTGPSRSPNQHRVSVGLAAARRRRGTEQADPRLLGAHARRRRSDPAVVVRACADESLVVIYRMLFLLFAEARGLVPAWHPLFRDSYTIEALRGDVERLARPAGLWETLQAISRLAHRGCRAGSLRVPAFNGRLFSPAHAPLADVLPLDDGAVRQALLELTTRPAGTRGRRPRADLLWRPRRRAARRRLRAASRLRAAARHRRSTRDHRPPQGHRLVLHAAVADRIARSPDPRAADRRTLHRRHPALARRRSGDGQRRVSGGRVPLPRACLRDGLGARGNGDARGTFRRRTGPASGGRWHSAACMAWT